MIPQEKTAAVTRGLQEAFGVTTIDEIHQVWGGQTTSLVFLIVVRGSQFLLKIIMRKGDPTRHFLSMKAAAEAGLAPHVWYASVEDCIFITDFVRAVPLSRSSALVRIPATLRKLHSLAPFQGVENHLNTSCMFLINKGAAADGFTQKFLAANVLSSDERDEFLTGYAQLVSAYPRHDPDMVSSHNDLFKPDNILFDGQQIWLVDWEAAFLNDRYADLAVVANMIVTNDAEEEIYLEEYFGHPPDQYQRARCFLMQQLAHMFYAMAYLYMASAGQPLSRLEELPDFKDVQRGVWAREFDLADGHSKNIYGRVHLRQFLQNMRGARLKEALQIVSQRPQ